MFHYSPSSRSPGYTSYLPRRSYRPASFDLDDERLPAFAFDLDDARSPSFAFEDLGYPSLRRPFQPPRIDAETRYRHALYELEAAEQEFEAHIALERARQVAAVRQRAAAEAARRQRVYAEVERVKRARALQAQVEEIVAQRQRALRTPAPFDRAPRGGHALLRALVNDNAEGFSVPHFFEDGPTRCQRTPSPTHHENETLTLGDLLGLLGGAGGDPMPQPASQPQRPTSPTPSQVRHSTEPQTQPQSPKHRDGETALSDILEFFHSIAAQARAAGGEQSTNERDATPQPEAAPAVDGKGKGKAKAEPAPQRSLLESLFRHGHVNRARDQEQRDLEEAIRLSLQVRDGSDVKKAKASKVSKSSPGASSSKVTVEDRSSLGRAGSPTRNATSGSIPTPAAEPVSPLTTIRAVRTQFSTLESAFKFPPVLDFDHSELAVSPNNAPVRTYEHALNGLLERLDTIESDGDEEVRNVRREVVREVERALEDVERKVKERSPRGLVPEITKEEAETDDAKREVVDVSATQEVLPAVVPIAEDAKPTQVNLAPVVSGADADVDLAISGEYETASAVGGAPEVATEVDGPAPATAAAGETSPFGDADAEVAPAPEDPSDSTATITPAPAVAAHSPSNTTASTPPAPETFLTSMSHDQFTFPPKPAFSQSSTGSGVAQDEDAVLVDTSSEGGSVRGTEEDWTEFDA